jgi:hypothetical protein
MATAVAAAVADATAAATVVAAVVVPDAVVAAASTPATASVTVVAQVVRRVVDRIEIVIGRVVVVAATLVGGAVVVGGTRRGIRGAGRLTRRSVLAEHDRVADVRGSGVAEDGSGHEAAGSDGKDERRRRFPHQCHCTTIARHIQIEVRRG